MENNYFFKSATDAAVYLRKKLDNPTPIKIQKGLYFIWAFYAATYGDINSDEGEMKDIDNISYPSELFDANFEAWKYGPVINEVWKLDKEGKLNKKFIWHINKFNKSIKHEVLGFVNDMISQINDVNDFGLVRRSHQDSAWINANKQDPNNNHHQKMDKSAIIKNYREYVKNQSKI